MNENDYVSPPEYHSHIPWCRARQGRYLAPDRCNCGETQRRAGQSEHTNHDNVTETRQYRNDPPPESPRRPELPAKRLFRVQRYDPTFNRNLVTEEDFTTLVEAHGHSIETAGALCFFNYIIRDAPDGGWAVTQYIHRAFNVGAWYELEEVVTTVPTTQAVN